MVTLQQSWEVTIVIYHFRECGMDFMLRELVDLTSALPSASIYLWCLLGFIARAYLIIWHTLKLECLGHRHHGVIWACWILVTPVTTNSIVNVWWEVSLRYFNLLQIYQDQKLKTIAHDDTPWHTTKGMFTLVISNLDHRLLKPLIGWEMSGGPTSIYTKSPCIKVNMGSMPKKSEKCTWKWQWNPTCS